MATPNKPDWQRIDRILRMKCRNRLLPPKAKPVFYGHDGVNAINRMEKILYGIYVLDDSERRELENLINDIVTNRLSRIHKNLKVEEVSV